ncbi:hypothetical protein D9757_006415 [Collybiopsis confluens]|uniref:Uncharacterized protein n=1 Tax=Collybiopsis confluens TaxID=2823264 RepID=A0A8H5HJT2_9AGAR|nr:hypothetical protein D9757_006415 [Collybiopsis confluens]
MLLASYFSALVLSIVLKFWFIPNPQSISSPKHCLSYSNSSLDDLITCLDAFTVPPNYYNVSSYQAAQPTDTELEAWKDVIWSMLDTQAGDCSDIILPEALDKYYALTPFFDLNSTTSYCALFETTSAPVVSDYQNYTYVKGWGVFVVPASPGRNGSRHVHISAPHPQADIFTSQQAAAIFALARTKSLLISGRFRSAFRMKTECITTTKQLYYKTDPTHDVNEPFHAANRVILEWQTVNGGCPSKTCAYVQMHGKGASSCPDDTIFISSGLGASPSSIAWYTNTTLDIPARRLRDAARSVFLSSSSFPSPSIWRDISLPSDSSTCTILTATSNVFGRLVNGVPENTVCTTAAEPLSGNVTGQFVHIEQAIVSREREMYEMWAEVFRMTWSGADEGEEVV